MSLRISGKNMDIGAALRGHVEDRIGDAVEKYFDGGFSGHVTMEREGMGFRTECSIHLDSGAVLQASALAVDPHVSADQGIDRIEKRLRRYKRRLKDHHPHGERSKADDVFAAAAARVLEAPDEDEEPADDYAPVVIAETETSLRQMTVASAVLELDFSGQPVVMFKNAANGHINVVYRRPDGNIGWIDPVNSANGSA